MKKIVILLATALLFIIACDVLDHEPYQNAELENFFDDFTVAFDNIEEENVDAVMVFYDSAYSNDLSSKEEMSEFYAEIFEMYPGSVRFYPELKKYNRFNEISWELVVTWEESENFTSETYDFQDIYKEIEGEIKFYGNQLDPPALDPTKPVVFAEYGTAETCGNCPQISKKLGDTKKQYGGQFIYVSFCQNEPVDPYTQFFTYYGAYTQPYVVMQGIHHNEGGTPENVALVESQYLDLLEGTPEAFITDVVWNEDSAGTIAGSVNLDLGSIPTEDLKLRVFILDEHPDLQYNADESNLHNVVFATYNIPVSTSGLVNYSLEYTQDDYSELPEHAKIVFALQTKPEDYNIATSKVYTAAEAKLYEE